MLPSLPQHDPLAATRTPELQRAREEYAYDYSYEGILYAPTVPLRDKSDPAYYAGLAQMSLESSTNKALATTGREKAYDVEQDLKAKAAERGDDAGSARTFTPFRDLASRLTAAEDTQDVYYPVASVAEYDRAYKTLRKPLPFGRCDDDAWFAWQALAGCHPTMIRRLDAPVDKLALTPAIYAASVGDHDDLATALAEGRVFVADYAVLDGVVRGQTDDHPKYVWAPIAVYAWRPNRGDEAGGLVPVCIQMGQDPATDALYTPADGASWRMARTAVAVGDSQIQGLMVHFGACHIVMEAVALAMKRQLSERHPLHALLAKHTENTLIANEICKQSLTNPGGIVDRLQAQELSQSMALCVQAIAEFRLMESSPAEDCARRGVDDVGALPVYPHRDDQLAVWEAVERWVDAYVRLYYGSDADVAGDAELQAFVAELGADEGGRLQGIGTIATVERLVHLMARIVFRASAFHATINYTLYDFTYAPNGPTSAFGEGPTGQDDEAAWLRMLPPWDIAYEVIQIYWSLQLRLNRLGEYKGAFHDPRVEPLRAAFAEELAGLDAEIDLRNQDRPWEYVFSKPELITESIHV